MVDRFPELRSGHSRQNGEEDPPRGKRRPGPDDRGGKKPTQFNTPRPLKTLAFWLMMTVVVLVAVNVYHLSRPEERKLTYSELYKEVDTGNVESITISGREARGELKKAVSDTSENRTESVKRFVTQIPMEPDGLVAKLQEKDAIIDGGKERPNWFGVALTYLPILLIVAFWLFFIRQMQSGGSAALKFGKSRAKLQLPRTSPRNPSRTC